MARPLGLGGGTERGQIWATSCCESQQDLPIDCLWSVRERDVSGMTDFWLENLGEWGAIWAAESTAGRSNFLKKKFGSRGRKSRILLWTF